LVDFDCEFIGRSGTDDLRKKARPDVHDLRMFALDPSRARA
jgi:hypothetical protein